MTEQIEEVTRLYDDFTEGEKVKIFSNEVFGYQRITVERPLRLRWKVTAETIEQLTATKQWAKVPEVEREALTDRLATLEGTTATEKAAHAKKLGALPKAVEKQLWDILAVADPEAPIIANRKGQPEPDPDLRDNENVPLPELSVSWVEDVTERLRTLEYRTAVEEYMTAEVLPYVPDAWVDHEKTKIGYEIPLTRYFYKYVPPRPLEQIDAEIEMLEAEIQELLREVTE